MSLLRYACVFPFAALLAWSSPTCAGEKDEHEHGKEESHFKVTPPATVMEAWTLITTRVSEAEKYLAANTVKPVHEIGEQLEAAVHTLSEKSDMVAAEKKTNLASALKQLDKAIDGLHHAAEEGDAARAGAEMKKIKSLLPLVEGLYPAGVLK